MSVQSAIVLAVVLALAVFAIWRNIKKGAPCECGRTCRPWLREGVQRRSNCGCCSGGNGCRCGEEGKSHPTKQ